MPSEHNVEVVKVQLEPHPDADLLSIATVKGWQCVVRTEDFKGVKLGVYIPIDSVCPDTPEFEFLGKKKRIKTVKLRGILSQGLLIPAKEGWIEGQDIKEEMGIVKWEPPPPPAQFTGKQRSQKDQPPGFDKYTHIQNIKNYPNAFGPQRLGNYWWKYFPKNWKRVARTLKDKVKFLVKGPQVVVITEKSHGTNSRFGLIQDQFLVGSHNCSLDTTDMSNIYCQMAVKLDIEQKLRDYINESGQETLNIVIYGEIFGPGIQDLTYDVLEPTMRLFDIVVNGHYLDWEEFIVCANKLGLEIVDVLYKGTFSMPKVQICTSGMSVTGNGMHIREGCVVKPVKEQFHPKLGRLILKSINPDYLLRKGGTEYN